MWIEDSPMFTLNNADAMFCIMTSSPLAQRTRRCMVFATVLIPVCLLAARFPDPGATSLRVIGASPDSGFNRPGLTKAKTPTACSAALDSAKNAAYEQMSADLKLLPFAARDTANIRMYLAIEAAKKAAATQCARRFKASRVAPSELKALVELDDAAGMDAPLKEALDRRIAVAATEEERAAALMAGVTRYATYDTTPGRTALAEPYAAQLDALGDSARIERMEAHTLLAGTRNYYQATDPLARSHADQALALARALPLEKRTGTAHGRDAYAGAIVAAADEDAATGDYKRALAVLNEGLATFGPRGYTSKSYEVRDMLDTFRRYALVGTPAPAIVAEHWLSAPAGTTTLPYRGKVSLVEFTTTWCWFCKKGYPAMRRLAAKYQDRGYQPMFVSLIEGDGIDKPDTVDAELAYDREYWVTGDSIGFPIGVCDTKIAVEPPAKDSAATKKDSTALAKAVKDSVAADSVKKARPPRREAPMLFKEYVVHGYPSYFFIDKNGIIRDVLIGHRFDLEQRFTAEIEQLLAEPTAVQ